MQCAVVGSLLLQGAPNLLGYRPAEHVEDLVPLVARAEEARGRLPHLRRVVLPQLRRDYLMYRNVKADTDRLASHLDLAAPFAERLHELGMLMTDHQRPRVRIRQVIERQL